MSQQLTDAIYTYLANTPADQRWGEGELFVNTELHESGTSGMLFLSTGALAHDGRDFLERALARVRHGFEQNEIPGFRGHLDDEPEQIWRHEDAEEQRKLLSLGIGLTLDRP